MKQNKYFFHLLCAALGITLACNIPSTQPPASRQAEATSTPTVQVTDTQKPTSTVTITPSPTVTFTPIAIQQLGTSLVTNFIQPLPLSTPIADPNSISGVAYNGYGPITGASVGISETYCGEIFREVKTDSQGRYALTGIQPGRYYLQFQSRNIINFCGEEVIKNSAALAKDIIRARDEMIVIFPRDEQQIAAVRPTIEWKAVAGASFYVVELSYQTSGEPGWKGDWTGKILGTWLTNQTAFTIPFDLNTKTDYKLNIIAYTAERLPLVWAFEIRFHY